jgi:transposase
MPFGCRRASIAAAHRQRLQELKTQSTNQQHALEHSAFDNAFISKQLTKLVAVYDTQIKAMEDAIRTLIDEDAVLRPRVAELVKIKRLALLSVAVLVAETNGFEGFNNQRHLVSYAGYDVVENQSGNHSGKTRISKKGNSRLRRILHMPAFNAVRFNEPTAAAAACKALYERVYERSGIKMKAYVAVQKRLLLMAYALWRHGAEYDPLYLKNQTEQDKKIVPTSGTTQDQLAEAEFSYL